MKLKDLRPLAEVTIGIIAMFVLIWLMTLTGAPKGCRDVVVEDVGGCDAKGSCAVKYDDGTFGRETLPVRGFGYRVCDK